MRKNRLLLVAVFVVALLILVACRTGGRGSTSDDDYEDIEPMSAEIDSEGLEDENVEDDLADNGAGLTGTITFNWWGNERRHDVTHQVVDLFVSENPGVTIYTEYDAWEGWQARISGDLAAGTEADLMQVNSNWLALYSPFGTTFMDLEDPIIAEHLDLGNWDLEYIDIMRRDGIVQGVPVGMTARVPFMRADIYNAAGLNIQDINTWDDLIEAGRVIQEFHGDDVFALSSLGSSSIAYMIFSYIKQFTGLPFVDDDYQFNYSLEDLERGFQLIQDFMDNGVMPDGEFDAGGINPLNPMWIAGHYGGVSDWDTSINTWIDNLADGEEVIEIRPHFTTDDALNSGWLSRPSLVFSISRNTQYPEVAAAFLNFMLTDERAIEIIATDRGVPLNFVGRAHFDAAQLGGLVVEANALHAISETTMMNPVFEFPEVREVYESQLMALFHGDATVSEAAEVVYTTIQAAIDSEVEYARDDQ